MNGGSSSARWTASRGCLVREWTQLVRERLGALGLSQECEQDVIAELAGHLDDRVAATVRTGMTEDDAVAIALEEVPDWVALNREISTAKKEEPMNERTRKFWLPGTTMLVSAYVLMEAVTRMVPHNAWIRPLFPLFIFVPWLLAYGVLGALGAHWSRRAGGGARTRFFAAIFPIALHVVIFLCVFIATSLQPHPRTPEWLMPSFLLAVFFKFILLPGIALAVGALPFLRDRTPASTKLTGTANA